ncbi:hypothetical protein ABL78_3292 [Leptomonas seymouri]|uniref:Uncharacterized protein n=1 Tax=Leptomonas seymouri TaxID=5684 RepID=A0A0N1PDT6_LEPSE|nr:hypothetical protein ABL78_3292 [Leptomonas seymouri]|eukprot:KPI87635.1 hypothetical protein ABL78_3292 [Leptomonas seymouri]
MPASSASSAVRHVVLEDDGEYFEEDPTVGRNVPRDPAGELFWTPMQPVEASEAFMKVVKESLESVKGPASPTA